MALRRIAPRSPGNGPGECATRKAATFRYDRGSDEFVVGTFASLRRSSDRRGRCKLDCRQGSIESPPCHLGNRAASAAVAIGNGGENPRKHTAVEDRSRSPFVAQRAVDVTDGRHEPRRLPRPGNDQAAVPMGEQIPGSRPDRRRSSTPCTAFPLTKASISWASALATAAMSLHRSARR